MASITVPPSKPQTWHQRFEWVKYANTLFRYYSRKSTYALRFVHEKNHIASVSPDTGIVRLNPDFVTPPSQHAHRVRHAPHGMRERIILSMKGYLAHEAAHVRFSSRKPAGLIGQIWNSIEDERIERLMSAAHPDLAAVFSHIGDIHLARGFDTFEYTPLEGVLVWRWAHDHPTIRWRCNDRETWARVLPHLEAAWRESNPTQVEEHAKRILEELRLPEDPQLPEMMQGPFVTCPDLPQKGDDSQDSGPSQTSDPQGDPKEDGQGNGDPQQQSDDSQSDGPSSGNGKPEDEQAQDDSQGAGSRKAADEQDQEQGAASGEEAGTEPTQGQGEGDPSDGGSGSEQQGNNTADGAGDGGVSYPGEEPDAPDVVPDEPQHVLARELLQEVEGHARDLAAALALPDAPNLRTSHESRGRFDYARYATGAQRVFRHKQHQGKKIMPRITLVHDRSGSMGQLGRANSGQYHAIRATTMLQRACELTRTPFNLITFENTHRQVVTHHDDPENARGRISSITSSGGTNLAPALKTALATTHPSDRRHVVIIYCDGNITELDANRCAQHAAAHEGTFILPILIGPKVRTQQFDRAFSRSLHVTNAHALAQQLKTWVSANLHT